MNEVSIIIESLIQYETSSPIDLGSSRNRFFHFKKYLWFQDFKFNKWLILRLLHLPKGDDVINESILFRNYFLELKEI